MLNNVEQEVGVDPTATELITLLERAPFAPSQLPRVSFGLRTGMDDAASAHEAERAAEMFGEYGQASDVKASEAGFFGKPALAGLVTHTS